MIRKIQIKNFKAIQAASVKATDLTVFVGNNGSGKSSVIEALQTLQNILLYGLSTGFNERWFGIEYIRNASSATSRQNSKIFEHDIEIEIQGKIGRENYLYAIRFNATDSGTLYLVTAELLKRNQKIVFEAEIVDEQGNAELFWEGSIQPTPYLANRLVLAEKNLHNNHEFVLRMANYIASWQFLTLEPERMYFPTRRDFGQIQIRMKSSGENLADFFSRLFVVGFDEAKEMLKQENEEFARIYRKHRELNEELLVLEGKKDLTPDEESREKTIKKDKLRLKDDMAEMIRGQIKGYHDTLKNNNLILDKMHYVLPDLENIGTEEIAIQKQIYLFLQGQSDDKRLPSWLLSSGTLRILALLAIFNSPAMPPVVFIEEIENGLDPRTLNLLVEEIRGVLPDQQVIVTTHSPYFLDLVALQHIVVAERKEGKTTYYRPDDDERLNAWKEKFSAGNLYTMNKLTRL